MKDHSTTAVSGTTPISFRRQVINNPDELPDKYSATPGGTLYSTTPGGTRIIYDRSYLMNLKNSPLAKSPPGMKFISGVTNIKPTAENNCYNQKLFQSRQKSTRNHRQLNKSEKKAGDDPQFDMDI